MMFKKKVMAIPFFILAGELMGAGGISDRMLSFARPFRASSRSRMLRLFVPL